MKLILLWSRDDITPSSTHPFCLSSSFAQVKASGRSLCSGIQICEDCMFAQWPLSLWNWVPHLWLGRNRNRWVCHGLSILTGELHHPENKGPSALLLLKQVIIIIEECICLVAQALVGCNHLHGACSVGLWPPQQSLASCSRRVSFLKHWLYTREDHSPSLRRSQRCWALVVPGSAQGQRQCCCKSFWHWTAPRCQAVLQRSLVVSQAAQFYFLGCHFYPNTQNMSPRTSSILNNGQGKNHFE